MSEYADYPISIPEARVARSGDAALWTPRDALISTLRRIDSGEINPAHIAIVMATPEEDGTRMDYVQCCPNTIYLIGLYARAMKELDK